MSQKKRRSRSNSASGDAAVALGHGPALAAAPSIFKQDVGTLARRHVAELVLIVITLVAYLPSFRGMYNWDDGLWLYQNDSVTQWTGLRAIWLDPGSNQHFYPLVFTTFWIEHKIWGLGAMDAQGALRPYGYHLTNTALHITAAIMLYVLLKRLKLPGGEFGAWLAAAIFALHPVNVESVAWISERKNCLSEVFFFGSLMCALRCFNVTDDFSPPRATRDYGLALLLFLLALLSKTTTCVLPVIVLILVWWRDGWVSWRQVSRLVPFFLLAAALGAVTLSFEREAGALGPEWFFSWPQRIVIAGRGFWFYLGKLLWPHPILQVYPRWPYDATDAAHRLIPADPLDLLYPAAAVVLLVGLFALRKKISRGPLAAMACFLAALLPALGFVPFYTQLYTFVADHYQYLAAPAAIVLVVEVGLIAIARLRGLVPAALAFSPQRAGYAAVVLAPLGLVTLVEGNRYADAAGLWQHTLDYNDDCFVGWNNLASSLGNRGDLDGAIKAYQRSTAIRPNDWRAYEGLRDVSVFQGDWKKAGYYEQLATARTPPEVIKQRQKWAEFRAKLAAENKAPEPPMSPSYIMGRRLIIQDQYQAALGELQKALAESPKDFRVPFEIGNAYLGLDAYENAVRWYVKALEINPDHAESFFLMGQALRALHREADANKAFSAAQRLDPLLALEMYKRWRAPTATQAATSTGPDTQPAATATSPASLPAGR